LPYRVTDGRTEGLLVTFVDVSTLVRAESRQRLLVEEMNHRVKNMLTVVISLATQSLTSIPTVETFSEAFLGRLQGLERTYSLLSRDNWSETALQELILDELLPYLGHDDANDAMDGPTVLLVPERALALGMVLHELATNAVKHGAFSVPQGKVAVEWRVREASDGHWLRMHWTEMNGPQVAPPSRRGFGVELIEKSLTHELGGDAYFEYPPSGLRVRLDFPIDPAVFNQNGTTEKDEE
jgi:two-component system CheB/CheR fusion protein